MANVNAWGKDLTTNQMRPLTSADSLTDADGGSAGAAADGSLNGFRLTLETGVPVSTSDQASKTTIYLTPFMHGAIDLYNGSSAWDRITSAEVSLALGTLTNGKNFDVFAYNSGGTLTLELSAAWTSDTARNDAVSRQDGVYVKTSATTRRLVGTIRTTSTTTTEDSVAKRFVANVGNRVRRGMYADESGTVSWSYNSSTVRQARGQTDNQIEYVSCLGADSVRADVLQSAIHSSSGGIGAYVGIGIDSTTTDSSILRFGSVFTATHTLHATYNGNPGLGYHKLVWLEATSGTATYTFWGNGGGPHITAGIVGEVFV